MILYLYLQIKPLAQINFASPLGTWIKSKSMDVLIAELDNHSETYLTSQALPLIERAEQVILHIECLNKEELGSLKVLFEGLRKHKKLANCVFSGAHAGLEQMLKMLRIPYKPYEGLESAQKLIEGILTDS